MSYAPTEEQQAIFDAVLGRGEKAISAMAGAGCAKTTTMEGLIRRYAEAHPQALITGTAFNTRAAKEFDDRICDLRGDTPESSKQRGRIQIRTIHSLGFDVVKTHMKLKFSEVKGNKYRQLAKQLVDERYPKPALENLNYDRWEIQGAFAALGDLVRQQLAVSPQTVLTGTYSSDQEREAVNSLRVRVGLPRELTWLWEEGLPKLLHLGAAMTQYSTRPVFDFGDMLWMIYVLNIQDFPQLDLFIFDEAQDASPDKNLYVERQAARAKHFAIVSDPKQVIYQWAGSNIKGAKSLIDKFGCLPYTLSTNFRCATTFIEMVNPWNPQLKARPNAPQGEYSTMLDKEFWLQFFDEAGNVKLPDEETLILSRRNAPLAALGSTALAQGIPFKIWGREIGVDLVKKLDTIVELATRLGGAKNSGSKMVKPEYNPTDRRSESEKLMDYKFLPNEIFEFGELTGYVESYRLMRVQNAESEMQDEATIQAIHDECDALVIFIENSGAKNYPDLRRYIIEMFADEQGKYLLGGSIHKAKGAEAHTVYLLMDKTANPIPSSYATSYEDFIGEWNLLYVAITRAKEKLILLKGSPETTLPAFPCSWEEYMALDGKLHPNDEARLKAAVAARQGN